jgi:hypothetical protein
MKLGSTFSSSGPEARPIYDLFQLHEASDVNTVKHTKAKFV